MTQLAKWLAAGAAVWIMGAGEAGATAREPSQETPRAVRAYEGAERPQAEVARLSQGPGYPVQIVRIDGRKRGWRLWAAKTPFLLELLPGPHSLNVSLGTMDTPCVGASITFEFQAEAGHHYTIEGTVVGRPCTSWAPRLRDDTTNRVVYPVPH